MKKNIIITGGQLNNKGAQAMTYITVDEISKRFPECDIVLVSDRDINRKTEELQNYKFKIISEPVFRMKEYIFSIFTPFRKYEIQKGTNDSLDRFTMLLKNAAALIDISGYALGSDWGDYVAIHYCLRILFAKDFHVPVYLMPQSFGPFSFNGIYGKLAKRYMRKALNYPQYIMGREKQGVDLLISAFRLNNVIKTDDLVLQNKGIDLNNIFYTIPHFVTPPIKNNSIGIIPNYQTIKHGDKTNIINLYRNIIDYCIEKGRYIYLLYHSTEDRAICDEIKDIYKSENKVINIHEELSCVEFDSLVKHFDYIIASRFHSVVHSYKNGIPAIVMGWAIKYYELAKSVCQESYVIDTRKSIDSSCVLETVMKMEDQYLNEALVIKMKIKSIQENNVYDYINLK